MTQQLKTKIQELKAQVSQLEQESSIDLSQASPQDIIKNAQTNTENRESAAYLKGAIASLEVQLAKQEEIEKQQEQEKLRASEFEGLVKQAEKVRSAIALLDNELTKLREMGKAISSNHYAGTGKLALDDRISRDYLLPKVEQLSNSIIIHAEARNYL